MNGWFAAAGALLVLLAAAHAVWGERYVFPPLRERNLPGREFVSLYVPWHQLTALLLLCGAGLGAAAFLPEVTIIAYMVLAVVVSNVFVFVVAAVVTGNSGLLSESAMQFVLFGAVIVLSVVGLVHRG